MRKDRSLTHERLTEVLDYDPVSGVFRWKQHRYPSYVGQETRGASTGNGYRYVAIDGVEYTLSLLAWFYVHREWADSPIRFRNKDRRDLSIGNLTVSVSIDKTGFDLRTKEGRNAYVRAHRQENPDYWKDVDLRTDFGITLEQYREMEAAQNGVCAICEQPETATRAGKVKTLAVDHCHSQGHVRGLLCAACNTGIGKLLDSPTVLRRAADYIERHRNSGQTEKDA